MRVHSNKSRIIKFLAIIAILLIAIFFAFSSNNNIMAKFNAPLRFHISGSIAENIGTRIIMNPSSSINMHNLTSLNTPINKNFVIANESSPISNTAANMSSPSSLPNSAAPSSGGLNSPPSPPTSPPTPPSNPASALPKVTAYPSVPPNDFWEQAENKIEIESEKLSNNYSGCSEPITEPPLIISGIFILITFLTVRKPYEVKYK